MSEFKKGKDYTGICICYFCHDGEKQFLMHKRSRNARDEQGMWDTGGGGLEFGEKVEDALKREVREEYGAEVLGYEFLGYRDVHRQKDGTETHWIALDFKAKIDPALAKVGEPDMMDELRWVTFESLPEPLHSQLPNFFESYRKKLETF